MTLSRFQRVVLLCPTALSGGPEAIHQMSYALNSIGVDCYVAYYGQAHRLRYVGDRLICEPPACEPVMNQYAQYQPRVAAEIPLDANTLMVLPEPLATRHSTFTSCGVAIWWLSVDNALKGQPELADPITRASFFEERRVHHLYQSVYAREFLREAGAVKLYDIGDFTSDTFTVGPAPRQATTPAASYNAAKGSDVAQAFFAQNADLPSLPLRGYTKTQLREIFSSHMFYIDFGHFPGKDRLPREAAAAGSIVFLHRKGSGAFYDDFPVPDWFKFDAEDIESGELARRLQAVVASPAQFWEQQSFFRNIVTWEKNGFHEQIMRHWGVRRVG